MPCYCDPSNEELDVTRRKIREKIHEICHLIKQESYPNTDNLNLMKDTQVLLADIFYGKCSEKDEK